MSILSRTALLLALIAVLAACSGAAAPSTPVGSAAPPSASPPSSEQPATGAIDHATGAADVILRYEEGGGFMMPAFVATQAPHFTLYGDGTIVFRNPLAEAPPAAGPVFFNNPFRTATLNEEQIQEILEYALTEGGLATAKAQYENNMVADAGTAIFTIDAGGVEKTVNVYALGLESEGVPDQPARLQFKALADRLSNFDQNGTIPTDQFTPTGYRAVLIDTNGFPGDAPVAWPWTDITPADFKVNEPTGQFFPSRVMTPEELAPLGVEGIEGGFQGLTLLGPEGDTKSYTLAVRPLLPGETG